MTIEKNDTFPDQKIRVLIDGEMQNIQSSKDHNETKKSKKDCSTGIESWQD